MGSIELTVVTYSIVPPNRIFRDFFSKIAVYITYSEPMGLWVRTQSHNIEEFALTEKAIGCMMQRLLT